MQFATSEPTIMFACGCLNAVQWILQVNIGIPGSFLKHEYINYVDHLHTVTKVGYLRLVVKKSPQKNKKNNDICTSSPRHMEDVVLCVPL